MPEIDIQGDLPDGVSALEIHKLLQQIWSREGKTSKLQLSILLTDSDTMREYNRQYRGLAESTDVLSFLGEKLLLGKLEIQLADIIIDTIQVFQQKGSKTYKEEFWQVLIHAILHLAGYEHIKLADKKKMEDAEENYRRLVLEGGSV